MKRALTCASLALGLVALAAIPAHADETTFCNFFITTLPYTVSAQGHYCFDRNLSTAITTGNAIVINSDFVVIDLNNFKLGGGSAGLGTSAQGITSSNHRNITIRNGNIRGFKYGIRLTSSGTGGGHLIENNLLDGNTYTAVEADGDSVVIRNNNVANTGGSTGSAWSYGILAGSTGTNGVISVRDNVISNVFDTTGSGISYGITGGGVDLADHNLIKMGDPGGGTGGTSNGIWASVCRDNTTFNATRTNSCTAVGANFP